MALLPSLLLLLLALVSSYYLFLAGRRARSHPPGPPKLPIIGNLHQLGSGTRLLHQSLWELAKHHGPLIHLQLGRVPALVVSSAELAREVLKTHDLACCSRPSLVSNAKLSYGGNDVGFTPYGDQWRQLRKFCTVELFSSKKIGSFRSIRGEEIDRMTESISSYARDSLAVNLSDLLLRLSCNTTCRSAFGSRYQDGGDVVLHDVLGEAQAMFTGFFLADYLPMLGWVDALRGMKSRLHKVYLKLDGIYQRIIDEHLDRTRRHDDDDDEYREDMVDDLLRMDITEDQVKGVLMNIFIGGTDTSSSTVEWAMAELMRHPEQMKRAQDEVRGYVGNRGKVEESDLPKLEYLKCIIKETMRLHPAAPLLLPRETMQHIELDGYDVPPKTMIYVNAWAIARDPSSWERPDVFDPERFFVHGSSSMDFVGNDFKLIPFGEGRRVCPGKNMGLLTVELVLANLLYAFDWDLPAGMAREDMSMEEATGITIHRKSALFLMATKYGGIVEAG